MATPNPFKHRPLKQSKHVSHPLVRVLVDKMNEQGVNILELCADAGVPVGTFSGWRKPARGKPRRVSPSVANIEACFNALGYTLGPIPLGDAYKSTGHKRGYRVTSPDGEVMTVVGLAEFCRKYDLNNLELYRAATSGKPYNGWRIERTQ